MPEIFRRRARAAWIALVIMYLIAAILIWWLLGPDGSSWAWMLVAVSET